MRDSKGRFVKGSNQTLLTRLKIRKSLRGKIGTSARRWKGMSAGYVAKHLWIVKHYGKANRCEDKDCTFRNPSRYEWCNVSGKYLRSRSDYMQLCPSCHRKFDKVDKISLEGRNEKNNNSSGR